LFSWITHVGQTMAYGTAAVQGFRSLFSWITHVGRIVELGAPV
jgi:hypothetical protein